MLTPEIQSYINQQRAAGISDSQIRQTLSAQGWQATDLDQAFGVGMMTTPVISAPATVVKKHSWLKIIGIVAVIFVIVIGVIVTFALLATAAPTKAARNFIQDMANNQPDQAYALTSKAFQQQNQEGILSDLITKYPDTTKISGITLNNRTVTNNTAEITGTVTTDTGTYPIDVKLINESGWKIYSFDINFGTASNTTSDSTTNQTTTTPVANGSATGTGQAVCGNWPSAPGDVAFLSQMLDLVKAKSLTPTPNINGMNVYPGAIELAPATAYKGANTGLLLACAKNTTLGQINSFYTDSQIQIQSYAGFTPEQLTVTEETIDGGNTLPPAEGIQGIDGGIQVFDAGNGDVLLYYINSK